MNINNIENINKKSYNASMEVLRGWVAMIVWIGHVLLFRNILVPDMESGLYFHPGHYSVLVFFMLSGYVIGLAYPKTNSDVSFLFWVKKYLWRRFVRLYPIYLVALILTFGIIEELKFSAIFILHLCFGQEAFTPTIITNAPLWSLHYEVLYYLLFVGLYFFRKKLPLGAIIIFMVIIGFFKTFINGAHWQQISFGYATGYAFWLTGLWIAWYLPTKQEVIQYGKIIAACLLAFALPVWNILFIGEHILSQHHLILPAAGAAVGYLDLLYLPSVFLLVLIPANVEYRYFSHLLLLVFLLSASHILYSLFYFQYLFARETHLLGAICFFLALICWHLPNTKFLSFIYEKLVPIGSISYGIYALHFPLMYIIGWQFTFHSSNKYAWSILLLAILTFILAYILEKKIQPHIKKWSNKLFK